jgi:carbohydrate diacid regulator
MALSLGRSVQGEEHVHSIEELAVAVFVGAADHRAKVDLARQLLAPLEDEPHLAQTLELFFQQDASASTAASRLSIHRNTLSYRLDRITALTGLDPRRFDDAVQLRLALFLRGQEVSVAKG